MSSTIFGGKILLKPVEEEKHEYDYGDEGYPLREPTVYLEGVVEEYYPQTVFSWSDDSVVVVRENRVIRYTRSSFTELLAKNEKGDIVWMDGRNAPYSSCWDGEYLDDERHGEEFTIHTYDLSTMKKQSYTAVLQKEEDMDNDDIRRISGYIETKEIEERFVIENGVLKECNAREDHIVIPDGVTSIYLFAFQDRTNTKSITLPKTLDELDWDTTFRYCTSLENVYVDKDNPKYYSINGSLIDRSTKTLVWANADFEIPDDDSIERIGKSAFYRRGITNIKIPSSVVAIEGSAFENCESLISIDISSSVLEIGENAFSDCKSLKNIVIPELIKTINVNCFSGCYSLESVTLPSSLTEIGYRAFSNCKSLKSLEIPSSVTKIGAYAFNACSALTEIKLPASVTEIGDHAFVSCKNLVSIELPYGIIKLGRGAFSSCESLTDVKIPSSVLEIGPWCFSDCKGLTKLDIPNSVIEIGENAFGWCESLTSLKLSSSLFKIPDNMCVCCKKLDGVVIPSSVYKISEGAFYACSSLENIEIPDTAKIIDNSAFNGCKFTSDGEGKPSEWPWGTDPLF